MHQPRERRGALRFAAKSFRNQLLQMFRGEGSERDLHNLAASHLDRLELLPQRMGRSDLVGAIGTNQHEMPQTRPRQQILQQIERRRVEPLQVVEKERQRMLRPGKYTDKPPKCQLETPARVVGRQIRKRRLVSDDELEFGNELDDEPSVRAKGVAERVTPGRQIGFALS